MLSWFNFQVTLKKLKGCNNYANSFKMHSRSFANFIFKELALVRSQASTHEHFLLGIKIFILKDIFEKIFDLKFQNYSTLSDLGCYVIFILQNQVSRRVVLDQIFVIFNVYYFTTSVFQLIT